MWEYSYQDFKKGKQKEENNRKIGGLLEKMILNIIKQNNNINGELDILLNITREALYGGNKQSKIFELEERKRDGIIIDTFKCRGTNIPVLNTTIKQTEDGQILSINSIHLTTLEYEGSRIDADAEKIEITNINEEIPNIKVDIIDVKGNSIKR